MASDTRIKFYGLGHLVGKTVQASVCLLDCGDYVVAADGTITVPFQSDEQQLLTPQFLVTFDGTASALGYGPVSVTLYVDDVLTTVTIPVEIGLGYTSQGQTLRPALAADLGIRIPGLGKVRRSHQVAALLTHAYKISFGTTFSNLDPAALTTSDGGTPFPLSQPYSGVYRGTLTDDYGYDSMIAWQVQRPWPAAVCALSAFLIATEE